MNLTRKIWKADSSRNPFTIKSYREQILPAYNTFVLFVSNNFFKIDRVGQAALDNKLGQDRDKFIACSEKLKCTYEIPNGLQEVIREKSADWNY